MNKQLSDCCKAEINLNSKLDRPECYTCSVCSRIIGSPLPNNQPEITVEDGFVNLERSKSLFKDLDVRMTTEQWNIFYRNVEKLLQAERQKRDELVGESVIKEIDHFIWQENQIQTGDTVRLLTDLKKAVTPLTNDKEL